MVDVFGPQSPLEIKTARLFVFVFDPASLLQTALNIAIATSNNEDLLIVRNSILFPPCGHISNIQKHLVLRYVPLDKALESLIIMLHLYFGFLLTRRSFILSLVRRWWRLLRWRCIFKLFKLLNYFLSSNFLYFFLTF